MNPDKAGAGLELARRYYQECVAGVMRVRFPDLAYDAALIGDGSEVLGFDTALSADHSWGPRLFLFLSDGDLTARAEEVSRTLAQVLPVQFMGVPTGFHCAPFEAAGVTEYPRGVAVTSIRRFFDRMLGIDPLAQQTSRQWLILPEHRLAGVAAGEVFHDGTGLLSAARQALRYYPRDVWLYLMAARWARIGEERAFLGRCGDVGDDLGSRIVAARLVKELMGLGFLIDRQYAPYAKWFGTAFRCLPCAQALLAPLEEALRAPCWQQREGAMTAAYAAVTQLHNDLAVTEPLQAVVGPYHTRPYVVVDSDRFTAALLQAIADPWLRSAPGLLGSVNQFLDQTDLLCDARLCTKAAPLLF